MIIDIHAHVFGDPRIRRLPDATPYMSIPEQLTVMDRLGIDKALILPLNNPETSAEHQSLGEILTICRHHPDRFIPACNIDPRLRCLPDGPPARHFQFLLEQYQQLGCKVLGEVACHLYWDDPVVLALLQAAQAVQMPVTFHTTAPDIDDYGLIDDLGFPRLEKVLQQFPDLHFLAHSTAFWCEISGDASLTDKYTYSETPVTPGGAVARLMRRYHNLHGDISAYSGYNALARDPRHAYEFIDEFQDRLLFGLDYCSVTNDPRHLQWLQAARHQNHISAQAFEKITWRNAHRLLKLKLCPA